MKIRFLVCLVALSYAITPAFAAKVEPVKAPKAMVVASEPLATQIGLEVLKKGGNAVDAAVSMGFAMAVTMPRAGNLGGGGFMMLSQHGLNFCARQGIPASLVFLDLNAFKPINDRFGHAEGDWALKAFAEQMKSVFRDSDIFARLGGDEFVVLLTNTTKILAGNIITRFRQSLEKYIQEANRGYDLSFSHGVVEFNPDKHHTVDILLSEGDLLMYECKNESRYIESQLV